MTPDPLLARAVELLTLGHDLYGGEHLDGPRPDAAHGLPGGGERLIRATASDDMRFALPRTLRMANALRSTAAADTDVAAALVDSRTEHALGRHATGAVLDDAHSDALPAADTPVGQREAVRRMAARLRAQRRHIDRSHRRSHLLARRMKRLAYPHRRQASQVRACPLSALRYEKAFAPGHVRRRIAAALDHLGISDPRARRNWIMGYQTLIARESGGRPSAVAAQPATAPGPMQLDGRPLGYARGIAQTLPATFAHYHQPGTSTNIYDPVANICASINYIVHRYGVSVSGENLVALVQQADARRPPKGY